MDADVVIAGAGVAGLSCAAALADAGLRVLVFEREGRPGGRAASWRDEDTGDMVDIGPHVLTNEHHHFLALLERLGTAGKVLWAAARAAQRAQYAALRVAARPDVQLARCLAGHEAERSRHAGAGR